MFDLISNLGVFFIFAYSVLIGVFMIGFWSFALLKGMIPEEEKPWAIVFHLFSEFTTASFLIISGLALCFGLEWARLISFLSLGMLLYIVIYSPGYYLQRKNKPMSFLFVLLIFTTLFAIITLLLN